MSLKRLFVYQQISLTSHALNIKPRFFHSFPASGDLSRLLITIANSLDLDLDRQNFLTPKDFFKNVNFEKKKKGQWSIGDRNHNFPSMQSVNRLTLKGVQPDMRKYTNIEISAIYTGLGGLSLIDSDDT